MKKLAQLVPPQIPIQQGAVLLVLIAALPARSRQIAQFWPELDTYIKKT